MASPWAVGSRISVVGRVRLVFFGCLCRLPRTRGCGVTGRASDGERCAVGPGGGSAIPSRAAAAASPATTGYLQALPYGGRALGAAVLNGQVGNLLCQNLSGSGGRQFQQVLLQSTDPIVAVSWQNRFDYFPLGATAGGYSDKTKVRDKATGSVRPARRGDTTASVEVLHLPYGGDIRIVVCKITSTGTAAVRTGPIAGGTAVVRNCARAASWQAEWVKSGGTGTAPLNFARYPTIWLTTPVDPMAQGWAIGDRIGVGVVNTAPYSTSSEMAPASRWTSVNHCFSRDRPDLVRSSFTYDRDVGVYKQSSGKYETEYFPILLIGHRRPGGPMIVKGNGSAEYAGANSRVYLSRNVRYRQIVRIPNNSAYAGKTVRQIDTALFRHTSTLDGSVVMQLKLAGPTPGARYDQGTLLAQASVPASKYLFLEDINQAIPKSYRMPVFPTSSAPAVQPGRTLYVEFGVTGSSRYVMPQMLNYLDHASNRGLLRPDWQSTLGPFQSKTGSEGWITNADHPDSFVSLGVQVLLN
jgi:hypothetical protein